MKEIKECAMKGCGYMSFRSMFSSGGYCIRCMDYGYQCAPGIIDHKEHSKNVSTIEEFLKTKEVDEDRFFIKRTYKRA